MTKESIDEVLFVKTQAGRAREIIRNLSRFSSQQTGPQDLVDLRDVIKEVVQLRSRHWRITDGNGKTEEVKGKAKQAAGNLTDDERLKAEGEAQEAGGKVQAGFGKARRKVGNAIKDVGDAIKK